MAQEQYFRQLPKALQPLYILFQCCHYWRIKIIIKFELRSGRRYR